MEISSGGMHAEHHVHARGGETVLAVGTKQAQIAQRVSLHHALSHMSWKYSLAGFRHYMLYPPATLVARSAKKAGRADRQAGIHGI